MLSLQHTCDRDTVWRGLLWAPSSALRVCVGSLKAAALRGCSPCRHGLGLRIGLWFTALCVRLSRLTNNSDGGKVKNSHKLKGCRVPSHFIVSSTAREERSCRTWSHRSPSKGLLTSTTGRKARIRHKLRVEADGQSQPETGCRVRGEQIHERVWDAWLRRHSQQSTAYFLLISWLFVTHPLYQQRSP